MPQNRHNANYDLVSAMQLLSVTQVHKVCIYIYIYIFKSFSLARSYTQRVLIRCLPVYFNEIAIRQIQQAHLPFPNHSLVIIFPKMLDVAITAFDTSLSNQSDLIGVSPLSIKFSS